MRRSSDPARPTGAHIFAAEYFAEEVRREIYERYGEKKLYEGGLSVREAEAMSQRGAAARKKPAGGEREKHSDTLALERRISDALGLAVVIDHKDDGGRLQIRYRTLEQLDDICLKLTRRQG